MANHRRVGADYGEAMELARAAAAEAGRAGRDGPARARARARGRRTAPSAASSTRGSRPSATGSPLALAGDLTAVAAELYQRLALVLYDSADYRRAEEALDTALGLCRVDGDESTEVACVTCLAYVLRERGEWSRTGEMCRELIDAGSSAWVAQGLLGAIHGFQGKFSVRAADAGRLARDLRAARPLPHVRSTRSRASPTSRPPRARTTRRPSTPRKLLERWEDSEDHPLRGLGPALGVGLHGRPRRPRRRARVRRGAVADRRRPPAIPTRSPRSPTRSARPRCSTATRRPPPSSSRARSRSTAGSTSRSSARRSSCAPASRWPPRATARPRSSASAAPTAPPASSAPARWRPRRRPRSRSSAARCRGG